MNIGNVVHNVLSLVGLVLRGDERLRVAVVDVNEGRLAKATSLGADVVLKAGPDIRDRVKTAFLGGVDFSIAAYGSEEVNQDALDVLNNRGKICLHFMSQGIDHANSDRLIFLLVIYD